MSNITFKNGTTLETIAVYGGSMQYQSAQRSTLEIVVNADKLTLEDAKKIWQDSDAAEEITIFSDEETSMKINYTIPVELKLCTLDGADVIKMKLAQKSELEIMQEKQSQDIDDVNAALCELAELCVMGGDE